MKGRTSRLAVVALAASGTPGMASREQKRRPRPGKGSPAERLLERQRATRAKDAA